MLEEGGVGEDRGRMDGRQGGEFGRVWRRKAQDRSEWATILWHDLAHMVPDANDDVCENIK